MIWNYRWLLTLLRIALLKWTVSLVYRYFRNNWKNWRKYNNFQHTISNSLNQTHTLPYKRKINFSPCYAPYKFLPYLVFTSKHKWHHCSQIYRITTVNLSSSVSLFIRLPNNSEVAWDRFVTPFSYGLWLAVAFTACAISVCLALINYGHERNKNLSLSTIFFNIHASFCRQG